MTDIEIKLIKFLLTSSVYSDNAIMKNLGINEEELAAAYNSLEKNGYLESYKEYEARRDCLKEYTKSIGINAILYIGNQEFGHIFYNIHLDTSLNTRLYFYQ